MFADVLLLRMLKCPRGFKKCFLTPQGKLHEGEGERQSLPKETGGSKDVVPPIPVALFERIEVKGGIKDKEWSWSRVCELGKYVLPGIPSAVPAS